MALPLGLRTVGSSAVRVAADPSRAGVAAAAAAAAAIRVAIDGRGEARILLASAPSQETLLGALVGDPSIDWSRVQAFHIDEYVGLPDGSPHSFGRWLHDRLSGVDLAAFHRMRPGVDPVAESVRYARLLAHGPVDLACLGVGVNGHIAFNEPGATSFGDPVDARVVALDEASRRQQVDDGLFSAVSQVPTHAVTLTVPRLLRAGTVVVTVHGRHKATAVAAALTGPVVPACPASAVRTHPAASWYIDAAAASLLDL